MTSQADIANDPYTFTGGGWLYRDQEERNSRHIEFNFDALRQKAVTSCEGAAAITDYQKKEGAKNRVFIFKTDNDKQVVAKVPFKLGGPTNLAIRAEAATVKFVQTHTSVPSPKVLGYSDDVSNPVGTEYIISEHASGVQLSERWPSMTQEQRIKCITAIHEKFKSLVDWEFPAYGNIYESAYATAKGLKFIPINEDFCIGPDSDGFYWEGGNRYSSEVKPVNIGPWESFEEYCNGALDAAVASIPKESSHAFTSQARVSWHGSPAVHIALLETVRTLMKTACRDAQGQRILDVSRPVLMPYLPKRHVFVSESDPTIITDIIDFQATSTSAPFLYASLILTFIEPNHSPSKAPDPAEDQLMQTWMQATMQHTPRLMASLAISQTFFSPIATCDQIWKSGAPTMQNSLQELREKWDTLGFESPCPIPALSMTETRKLHSDYVKSRAAMQMHASLTSRIGCRYDRFVPTNQWIEAVAGVLIVWNAFSESIGAMDVEEGIEMSAEDVRLTWPFDIPTRMGEDLVMISPRFISTAIPGMFGENEAPEREPTKEGKARVKEEKKKHKAESKGGLFKGLKKRFS